MSNRSGETEQAAAFEGVWLHEAERSPFLDKATVYSPGLAEATPSKSSWL